MHCVPNPALGKMHLTAFLPTVPSLIQCFGSIRLTVTRKTFISAWKMLTLSAPKGGRLPHVPVFLLI